MDHGDKPLFIISASRPVTAFEWGALMEMVDQLAGQGVLVEVCGMEVCGPVALPVIGVLQMGGDMRFAPEGKHLCEKHQAMADGPQDQLPEGYCEHCHGVCDVQNGLEEKHVFPCRNCKAAEAEE